MLGVSRHIYNTCVALEQEGRIDGASTASMIHWRRELTNKDKWLEERPWYAVLPNLGRQKAVESFFDAKKVCLKRAKQGGIKRFRMRKRSKYRSRQETVPFERYRIRSCGRVIDVRDGQRGFIPLRVVGKICKAFRHRQDTPFARSSVALTRTNTGKWYINVLLDVEVKEPEAEHVCALDPGCRTFQTVYGTDGLVAEVGPSFAPIERELLKADKVQASITDRTCRSKRRRELKRRLRRTYERVRNRVRDLHHKVASWLCKHYRVILLPKFETQQMVNRLSSKVSRSMMTWSHYMFQQRLLEQAHHKGNKVLIVSEAWTSKTCGRCGRVNEALGASKVFMCPSCGVVCDRDANAARNILLRNLKHVFDGPCAVE